MNRKQRKRRHERRSAHERATARPNLLVRSSFPPVKRAHIVPRFYQANFAVNEQVDVWSIRDRRFERRNIDTAGTRWKFYRRTRPDGTEIDDIEASLSVLERECRDPLLDLVQGGDLTRGRKAAVAQLLGMQLARSPHFFEDRTELWSRAIGDLAEEEFTPAARQRFKGDVAEIRRAAIEVATNSSAATISMLRIGSRLGGVLANMRWQLLRTPEPWFVYSDHPVVVWPAGVCRTEPFPRQQHGPLGAIEVRAPLSPGLAVVMTWHDSPDATLTSVDVSVAAELNAFTVAQADWQWMRQPATEPPVAAGSFAPLSPRLDPSYELSVFESSYRRSYASRRLRLDAKAPTIKHFSMLEYTFGAG